MTRRLTLPLLLFASSPALAGWPVFDASNLAENLRQLAQMEQTYERQYEQLQEAVKQVEATTGNYGMGELLNDMSDRDARRYTPSSWRDTLQILKAGGLPGSVADVRAIYQAEHDATAIADAADYNRLNPDAPNAQAFERRRNTNYAASAIAEVSYNDTEQRLDNYESLMARIEATQNVKASSDLLARIAAENGLSLTDLVRLQSVEMQQVGAVEAQQLVDETNMKRQTHYEDYTFGNLPTD